MKRFVRTFLPILMLGTLAAPFVLIESASASAVSGDGTMVVSPTSTSAGSTGNILSFTFTANQGGGPTCGSGSCAFSSGSYLTLVIPAGWTAPNTTSGTPGYTTVTGCSSSIASISGTGPWTITVTQACSNGASLTITYGAGSGGSVTAPTPPGTSTFSTSTHQGSGGTATAITTSPTVTVIGPAAQLVFTTSPVAAASGSAFTTEPVIKAEDSAGNVVTSFSGTIGLAASTGGSLTSCTSLTASSGVVTLNSTCKFSGTVGTQYTLTATYSGLTSGTSASFAPTSSSGSSEYKLAVTTSPIAAASGSTFTTQPVVKVESETGTVITGTGATDTIALTIASGSGGTLSGCSSLTATGGIVNVAGCTFSGVIGTQYTLSATDSTHTTVNSNGPFTSASFSPTGAGPASTSNTTITANPTSVIANGTSSSTITVQAVDAAGNDLTSSGGIVTLSTTAGSLSSPTATDNGDGTYTDTLTSPTTVSAGTISGTIGGSAISSSQDATVNFVAGPATQLVFTTQPGNGVVNIPWSQQPIVKVEDAHGNVVTSDSEAITLAIANNAGPGGTLSGCSATTINGVASFSGCQIDTIGQGYTLQASNAAPDNFTSLASSAFNITGLAAQLVFTTSPVAGAGGSATALTTQPVVKVEDLEGNVVTSFSGSITLASSGGTLSSCSGLTAVSGVVTVTGCTFNGTSGTSYYLTASSSGLTSGTSASFVPTYSSGSPASKLVFTTSPVAGSSGSTFAVQPVVEVESQRTNAVVSTFSSTITLTATSGGTLSSCSGLTASSGVVNVSSCTFAGLIGTQYTLTASYSGLTERDKCLVLADRCRSCEQAGVHARAARDGYGGHPSHELRRFGRRRPGQPRRHRDWI